MSGRESDVIEGDGPGRGSGSGSVKMKRDLLEPSLTNTTYYWVVCNTRVTRSTREEQS